MGIMNTYKHIQTYTNIYTCRAYTHIYKRDLDGTKMCDVCSNAW